LRGGGRKKRKERGGWKPKRKKEGTGWEKKPSNSIPAYGLAFFFFPYPSEVQVFRLRIPVRADGIRIIVSTRLRPISVQNFKQLV